MPSKIFLIVSLILTLILSACGSKSELDQPVIAPVCPEGFHWIESEQSCIILEDDMSSSPVHY